MKRLLSFELGLNAIPKHSRNVCLQGQTFKTFPQHLPRLFEQAPHTKIFCFCLFPQLLDACLAPDTSGDGSGCDNMTSIVVLFNSDSKATENNKKRKLEDEKPDSESADKRIKGDES